MARRSTMNSGGQAAFVFVIPDASQGPEAIEAAVRSMLAQLGGENQDCDIEETFETWLDLNCARAASAVELSSALWRDFRAATGCLISQRAFGLLLSKAGFESRKTNGRMARIGVRLLSPRELFNARREAQSGYRDRGGFGEAGRFASQSARQARSVSER